MLLVKTHSFRHRRPGGLEGYPAVAPGGPEGSTREQSMGDGNAHDTGIDLRGATAKRARKSQVLSNCQPALRQAAFGPRHDRQWRMQMRPFQTQRGCHIAADIPSSTPSSSRPLSFPPSHSKIYQPPAILPSFDLDWRAVAVVLEGGTEGVDAEAVKACFVATAPTATEGGRIIWCVCGRGSRAIEWHVSQRKDLGHKGLGFTFASRHVRVRIARAQSLPCQKKQRFGSKTNCVRAC